MAGKKRDLVQLRNPRTGHYVKIDRSQGKIVSHKKTAGPYKGVPIARKRRVRDDWELAEEQWEELRRRREAHLRDPSGVRPWEELCDRVRNVVRNAD